MAVSAWAIPSGSEPLSDTQLLALEAFLILKIGCFSQGLGLAPTVKLQSMTVEEEHGNEIRQSRLMFV